MNLNSLINDLKKEYKYKTELHCHTNPVSSCSEFRPGEVIDLLADLGYSAVVLTNHYQPKMLNLSATEASDFFLADYREAKEEGEKKGISVILAVEICFSECSNDYLVYGIEEKDIITVHDYIDKGIEVFYREFKNERNLILQAHPFRKNQIFKPHTVDGIEVFNLHPGHNSKIGVAAMSALDGKLIHTGGTDLHHHGHEGISATLVKKVPNDSFEVAELIKSGDFLLEIGGDVVLFDRSFSR